MLVHTILDQIRLYGIMSLAKLGAHRILAHHMTLSNIYYDKIKDEKAIARRK
jgi:hypothetical protein